MSIINPFSSVVILPAQVAGTAATEIDLASAAVKAVYPIQGPCQVTEWGFIVTTTFSANATDPVVKLQRRPLITGTAVDIMSITLGSSNANLRKYTSNPDAVAAGGPGVVTVGPSIGGHTSPLSADTDLTAGTVIIADTKSMPSTVLAPGDLLQVNVTTAATTGGKVVCWVRLEPVAEKYTTAYVLYDAVP
jgi:hypothetical protein